MINVGMVLLNYAQGFRKKTETIHLGKMELIAYNFAYIFEGAV